MHSKLSLIKPTHWAKAHFYKPILIFVPMADKLKKSIKPKVEIKPLKKEKFNPGKLKNEREERVDLKKLAKDERTHKIIGTVFLLISIFLLFSFLSYFFTWKEDQDKVFNNSSFLFDENIRVNNLLGRLGAYVSHFFIYRGFGIASLLFCTFFFVVGINLLVRRKVFSIWRNLRYVTVGLLVASVCFAFLFPSADFHFGGEVGKMINSWLVSFLGLIGTGAVLLVLVVSYLIWQFNPTLRIPERKEKELSASREEEETSLIFNEKTVEKSNHLKGGGQMVINPSFEETENNFEIIERNNPEELTSSEPIVEKEIADDLMHNHELENTDSMPVEEVKEFIAKPSRQAPHVVNDIALEIKTPEETQVEKEVEKTYSDLPPYEPTLDLRDYKYPRIDLLEAHGSEKIVQDPAELENNKNQIITTLRNYDIEIQKIFATVGPTVTLYEIIPAAGVRISRIKNLEDDIALSLAALGIRIIAPIPGKGTIGIEVPNVKKTVVSMKTLLASEKFQHSVYSLPIAIGKKIDNDNFIVDLASMPHLLMAGATGQGKSVGLNAILVSLLYKKHPSQLKFVLIDPKKVELSVYRFIENHFLAKLPGEEDAIITDTKKVINTLNALCIEMDNRYDLLKEAGARNIREYNEKFTKRRLNPLKGHQYLPFIVLVIDEFADLIMTAGKEVEMPIARLAQLARAVGIHLIIATQRPSVNIITGTIKANFPSRIAFKVSSKIDSRTILDAGGAEQLIGKGDMLISHNGEIVRLQCAFVDTPEVERVVEFIQDQRGYPQPFLLPEYIDEKDLEGKDFDNTDKDPLFEDAARLIVQNQIGSTSLLQRRMKLGYNRAGRLMDQLEAARVVGPNAGSKAREVLIKTESELQEFLKNLT